MRLDFRGGDGRFDLKWVGSPAEVDYESLHDGGCLNYARHTTRACSSSQTAPPRHAFWTGLCGLQRGLFCGEGWVQGSGFRV